MTTHRKQVTIHKLVLECWLEADHDRDAARRIFRQRLDRDPVLRRDFLEPLIDTAIERLLAEALRGQRSQMLRPTDEGTSDDGASALWNDISDNLYEMPFLNGRYILGDCGRDDLTEVIDFNERQRRGLKRVNTFLYAVVKALPKFDVHVRDVLSLDALRAMRDKAGLKK